MRNKIIVVVLIIQGLISCESKEKPEDFREFLVHFSSKSDFQVTRIKFPLESISLTEDMDATKTNMLNRTDWKYENIFYGKGCSEIYPQVFDNFEMKLKESDERVLAWRGIENGIAIFYYFKLIDGKWFLVKKEDSST